MAGNRAFLLRGGGVRQSSQLTMLDIAALPVIRNIGELPVWRTYGVASAGEYVLAADGATGLRVIGSGGQGEEALVERHREPTIGDAGGLVVAGEFAYVTDWDNELWVLDVAEPDAPRVAVRVDLKMPDSYFGAAAPGAAGLVVRDGYAYIARTAHWVNSGGIHVVDVTTPTAPRQVAAWDGNTESSDWSQVTFPNGYPPAVAGDRLFLTGEPLVTELKIADPAPPRFSRLAELRYPPNWGPTSPKAGDVAIDGERAWVAEPVVGLQLLDLADPAGLRQIVLLDTPGEPSDVAVIGEYVLLADGSQGLRVIDKNTFAPVRSIEDKNAVRINVAGTTAFLVGYLPEAQALWPSTMRLWAVDVADPAQPVVRGEYLERYGDSDPPPETARVGDTLYVTAAGAGLDIVRLAEGGVLQTPTRRVHLPAALARGEFPPR